MLAEHIPGARLVELPGDDHLWWVGDSESITNAIEEFLTGARHVPEPDRVLVTVLFTDIVDSTRRAAEMGDRRCQRARDLQPQGAFRRLAALRSGALSPKSNPPDGRNAQTGDGEVHCGPTTLTQP